jgi:3-methylcrotonyl-CoA carboxylase alpha subunit
MPLAFTFSLDGVEHAVTIARRQPELVLNVDDGLHTVTEAGALSEERCALLTVDGRSYQVWRTWEGDRIHLRIGGRSFSLGYEDPITAAQHHAGGDDMLRADMPGVVVGVHCSAGAHVGAGDTLIVIESMKMQINVVAPRDGVVEAIYVEVNQTFDKGAHLISLHQEA